MQHVAGGHLLWLLIVDSPLRTRMLRLNIVSQRIAKLVKRHAVDNAFATIWNVRSSHLIALDRHDIQLDRMAYPRVGGDHAERFAIDQFGMSGCPQFAT